MAKLSLPCWIIRFSAATVAALLTAAVLLIAVHVALVDADGRRLLNSCTHCGGLRIAPVSSGPDGPGWQCQECGSHTSSSPWQTVRGWMKAAAMGY